LAEEVEGEATTFQLVLVKVICPEFEDNPFHIIRGAGAALMAKMQKRIVRCICALHFVEKEKKVS
jgi:hypothetical protein